MKPVLTCAGWGSKRFEHNEATSEDDAVGQFYADGVSSHEGRRSDYRRSQLISRRSDEYQIGGPMISEGFANFFWWVCAVAYH